MDRDLLSQCLVHHGESLLDRLKCEQAENPDFQALVADLSKATHDGSFADERDSPLVTQFIARKADILFCPAWKTANPPPQDDEEEEDGEPYAIMPPAELFMELPYEERRSMMYRDLERGDVVVGRINNIREYGFFLTLLCMAGGLKRDIEDLELSALCHIKEIPSSSSHDDPLSYYQIGDLIKAAVKDIDRFQEKITVSLHQASLSPNLERIKLGVIAREDLPVHYRRSVGAAASSSESYDRILTRCHGYENPSVVEYLLQKVGISDTNPPSMMRGLQCKLFQEEDFAAAIRKKQSATWALKCVRAGVDHFKHGRHVEAMNEYNKALEIDANNVEALVARGALYANKGGIVKAISDFELALENCPDHHNAKKYLCQTLVERGKQLEEQEKLVTAEGLYRRALSLDDSNAEAKEALRNIDDTIQKSIRLREEALAKEPVKATSSQISAEKLRKILKEEKRAKKKRKRSSSSSSSLSSSSSSSSRSSSSSSSSSSSRRRSRKKKKKRKKKSGREGKRRRRKSEEGKSGKGRTEKEEEEDGFPAPANTSATFLHQRGGPLFAGGGEDGAAGWGGSGRSNRKASRSPERERAGGRDGDPKRRSSAEEKQARRLSCSSAEAEHPRRAAGSRARRDSSTRSSFDGRYESREEAGGERRPEPEPSRRAEAAGDESRQADGKKLPSHLLDIFNQIARFEKEKGARPRK